MLRRALPIVPPDEETPDEALARAEAASAGTARRPSRPRRLHRVRLGSTGPPRPYNPGTPAGMPGAAGSSRGDALAGVTGQQRVRGWDAITVAATDGPPGVAAVRFVVLTAGAAGIVVEEGPAEGIAALADAMSATLPPPYRAEAVRKEPGLWAVAATSIHAAVLPDDTPGNDIVLSRIGGEQLVRIDDFPAFLPLPAVAALAAGEGQDFVVRATRLQGTVWEVAVEPL